MITILNTEVKRGVRNKPPVAPFMPPPNMIELKEDVNDGRNRLLMTSTISISNEAMKAFIKLDLPATILTTIQRTKVEIKIETPDTKLIL